jgi:S-methylmethionine-dependent homocysteine/selenocysteine methylase
MVQYRNELPQLSGDLFLTDGGLETTLIFHDGLELPDFAAFDALKHVAGRDALLEYFCTYASIARKQKVGFILESPTWRASQSWADRLGYSREALAEVNRDAIELLSDVRKEFGNGKTRIVISGCIGPRGDGYNPTSKMTEDEAERYHATQIGTLSETDADMIAALTMNYVEEAIGVSRAARLAGMPVVISFTVETDGRLPSGHTLKQAIDTVDEATDNTPAYYMINCAHPTHFMDVLDTDGPWSQRIHGIRANASSKSHNELDEAEELDDGNPTELASQCRELRIRLSNLNVFGGCCGTDHRHVEEMGKACLS